MFGSHDDKKTPAANTAPATEKPAEKKDLFGWLRKKPQAPASNQSVPTPAVEAPAPVQAAAPAAEPLAPVAAPAPTVAEVPAVQPAISAPGSVSEAPLAVAPAPATQAEAGEASAAPRPSRFRINAGSEVLHAHVELPPLFEEPEVAPVAAATPSSAVQSAEEIRAGFLERLKQGLAKTSASLGEGMASLFLGKKVIDDELLEDIETRLLTADVGVEATTAIVQNLTKRVARKELADSGALYKALQEELCTLLKP
ncbi:MAG TPA: signal recognition particle receptor subunit alpha, partial [Pseudomonas sp.]|nr:signal recognition particle receptor subunit alpha [Pseudomonas sp.]